MYINEGDWYSLRDLLAPPSPVVRITSIFTSGPSFLFSLFLCLLFLATTSQSVTGSLVAVNTLHAVGTSLCKTGDNHRILKIFKRLLLLLLQVLESANELLFAHFQLLGLAFVFVDQLFLVVNLLTALCPCVGQALVLEVSDRVFTLGDHLADGLAFHSLIVLILHVELLLARQVILKLIFNDSGTLHLRHVHVVAGILHLLAPLLLTFEGLVATFTLLLLSVLGVDLLLEEKTRKRKSKHKSCNAHHEANSNVAHSHSISLSHLHA